MNAEYDCIYYWNNGEWFGVFPINKTLNELYAIYCLKGYYVVRGIWTVNYVPGGYDDN